MEVELVNHKATLEECLKLSRLRAHEFIRGSETFANVLSALETPPHTCKDCGKGYNDGATRFHFSSLALGTLKPICVKCEGLRNSASAAKRKLLMTEESK